MSGHKKKHRLASLTDEQVVDIRRSAREGVSAGKLAARYGVSVNTAALAAKGKTYKHVSEPPVERLQNLRRKQLTDDQVAQLREEVRAGATIASVAKRFGVHQVVARHAVRGRSYKHVSEPPVTATPASPSLTDAQVSYARQVYREGMSAGRIAAELGVSEMTIYSAVKGHTYKHVDEPPVLGRRKVVKAPDVKPAKDDSQRARDREIWFRRRRGEEYHVIAEDLAMTKGAVQNAYYRLRYSRDRREKIGIFEDPSEAVAEEEEREGHMKMTLWQSKWMTKGELGARLRRDVRDLERANAKGEPLQVFEDGERMVYDIERSGQKWRARRIEG